MAAASHGIAEAHDVAAHHGSAVLDFARSPGPTGSRLPVGSPDSPRNLRKQSLPPKSEALDGTTLHGSRGCYRFSLDARSPLLRCHDGARNGPAAWRLPFPLRCSSPSCVPWTAAEVQDRVGLPVGPAARGRQHQVERPQHPSAGVDTALPSGACRGGGRGVFVAQ